MPAVDEDEPRSYIVLIHPPTTENRTGYGRASQAQMSPPVQTPEEALQALDLPPGLYTVFPIPEAGFSRFEVKHTIERSRL